MWQRIQTLWLLLAGVAMTLTLIFPLAILSRNGLTGSEILEMTSLWVRNSFSGAKEDIHWGLFALNTLIVLFSFGTIFLFKKRRLQMRICMFTMLLTVGYLIYFSALAFGYTRSFEAGFSIKFACALPIVSIILLVMAHRGIRRDDILVRISNRIR